MKFMVVPQLRRVHSRTFDCPTLIPVVTVMTDRFLVGLIKIWVLLLHSPLVFKLNQFRTCLWKKKRISLGLESRR